MHPSSSIQPLPGYPGTYNFDAATFAKVPHFDWSCWFTADFLEEARAPKGQAVKDEARAVDIADL